MAGAAAVPSQAPVAVQVRSRRTRRALLDAGFALLEREGPQALTITAVSARAGVAAGTVYRRFGDKDGLLAELQEEFTAGFREEFAARMSAARLSQDATAQAAIDLAVRALADTFCAHAPLLRVFVMIGMSEATIAEAGARASHEGGRLFRDVLWPYREEISSPRVEHSIDVTHRLVYAACLHRVLHGPHAESPTALSWEQLTDELVRMATLSLLGTVPSQTRLGRGRGGT